MKHQNGLQRPKTIKLIRELDLDLTKRGIRTGEEFHVYGFEEKTGACYIQDSRVDYKYPFVVWKENYQVLEYFENPQVLYETEEERALHERLEALNLMLQEVQGKIERTCPNCNSGEFMSLSSLRQELRKEIIELNRTKTGKST